jgi:hypothetical protein
MDARFLAYRVNGSSLCLRVEDHALLAPLRSLFPSYEVPDSGAPADLPAVTVRRAGTAWSVTDRGGTCRCATSIEVAEAVEYALTQAFLALVPDAVHLHAAAVLQGDGATVLVGGEGSGKTSLAFWLSRRGHPVLGDDVALVRAGSRVDAFKRLFKVDPAVLLEAALPVEHTRLWEPGASTAWYDPSDGAGWANDARIASLVLLERGAGRGERLRPLRRSEALSTVLSHLLATGVHGSAAFASLADAVRGADVARLSFASAARGALLLEETFG